MANAWLAHVKKTMRAHKGMKFGQVLKMAKSSYKKGSKKGGASPVSVSDSESSKAAPAKDDLPAADVTELPAGTGGRRRRSRGSSRRTRRQRRR
jgi:hypothetical protein